MWSWCSGGRALGFAGWLVVLLMSTSTCSRPPGESASPEHSVESAGELTQLVVVQNVDVRRSGSGAAIYFELLNQSEQAITLVGVEVASDAATKTRAELHTTRMDGDVMRMRPLERLEIGSGETVSFEPGGHHVMVSEIPEGSGADENLSLKLRFESGVEVPLAALARENASSEHQR